MNTEQPNPLTDEELNAIEARSNAATPAPWEIVLGSGEHLCTGIVASESEEGRHVEYIADCLTDYMLDSDLAPKNHVPNMEFIAASRSDVPRLIAEIRRQRAVLDQVDARTKRIETGMERAAAGSEQVATELERLRALIVDYATTPMTTYQFLFSAFGEERANEIQQRILQEQWHERLPGEVRQ